MIIERSVDWSPPAPNYGGVDLKEYFALMFSNEVLTMICVKAKRFDFPIVEEVDVIIDKQKEITHRMKERNTYFYKSDGSIFMDYKIMRGEAFLKIGEEMGITDQEEASIAGYNFLRDRFNQDMSTYEALLLARSIVANWDWSQD